MAISENRDRTSLDLRVAEKAAADGDLSTAGEIVNRVLSEEPHNVDALITAAKVLFDSKKPAFAMALAEKAKALAPHDWRGWHLMGACDNALQRPIGLKALEHALRLSPGNVEVLRQLSHAAVVGFKFELAEKYAREALANGDTHPQAHTALAFALLHKRQWGEGWDEYAYGMGTQQWRPVLEFGDLKEWNGEDGPLLVYAEQGLGDQIAYCSTIRDANVSEVVCHPKLQRLLAASLPQCAVYGDQFAKEIHWQPTAKYKVSMSGLQRWYRRTADSFPKDPYLTVHPVKQYQWRATFKGMGPRPKIGLAWTGGSFNSAGYFSRNLSLYDLLPILRLDADFICLEYKDRLEEIEAFEKECGIQIHDFEWGTQTENYEDTAALVSCLDAVVCVPTTVYHLAGALNVPAIVLVHDTPYFHEGLSGDSPWWGSVEFIRRRGPYIQKAAERLREIV